MGVGGGESDCTQEPLVPIVPIDSIVEDLPPQVSSLIVCVPYPFRANRRLNLPLLRPFSPSFYTLILFTSFLDTGGVILGSLGAYNLV